MKINYLVTALMLGASFNTVHSAESDGFFGKTPKVEKKATPPVGEQQKRGGDEATSPSSTGSSTPESQKKRSARSITFAKFNEEPVQECSLEGGNGSATQQEAAPAPAPASATPFPEQSRSPSPSQYSFGESKDDIPSGVDNSASKSSRLQHPMRSAYKKQQPSHSAQSRPLSHHGSFSSAVSRQEYQPEWLLAIKADADRLDARYVQAIRDSENATNPEEKAQIQKEMQQLSNISEHVNNIYAAFNEAYDNVKRNEGEMQILEEANGMLWQSGKLRMDAQPLSKQAVKNLVALFSKAAERLDSIMRDAASDEERGVIQHGMGILLTWNKAKDNAELERLMAENFPLKELLVILYYDVQTNGGVLLNKTTSPYFDEAKQINLRLSAAIPSIKKLYKKLMTAHTPRREIFSGDDDMMG